ncbi:NUDIX hydrolase [Pseudonocardia hydrocarbonoxydans]|uniref:NUDIX hydrolase n=1 Tax=Pseudonocardia hydrocarbonoxydans TaxID=76726 RepID=A0A4Y3WP63_9PSEU|nr:NUDIX hydrolase [Pseudonocardia hydrocarbonoxydans]GEC19166.1 NUDIX hydrolase [Pseudonocardia hydrocarbonoxydans]
MSTRILAAGAVLWRRTDTGVELALVHRPRYDDWSLPKGKLDRGESMPHAAVREIAEETGVTARLGARLTDVHYAVPEGPKTVRYWAAEARAGAFAVNAETDELRWCSPEQAGRLLSYRHDLDVLARFAETGVPDSVVLLVRHAKAGNRAQWDGPDDDRPLSGTGHEQARHLAALLPLYGPDRLASAPPLRCRATLAPFAAASGLAVADEPLLGEEGYWDDPPAGLARFHELAARPGVTVVCSQGGVIPDVVGTLTGETEVPSRKASTWVLGFTKGELRSWDHHPRPTG